MLLLKLGILSEQVYLLGSEVFRDDNLEGQHVIPTKAVWVVVFRRVEGMDAEAHEV